MSGTSHTIALVAHDNKKADLLSWASFNRGTLSNHTLGHDRSEAVTAGGRSRVARQQSAPPYWGG